MFPWIIEINQHFMQKKIFNSFEEEINEAIKQLDLLELNKAKLILSDWLK